MRQASKSILDKNQKINEPLLKIPEQKILIFNDRIQIGQKYQKITSLNSIQTNPTLTQIPYSHKQIYFSSTDIVFKLIEKEKKFLLSKIYSYQKPFLEMTIQNNQQRKIVHQILRKKWCEAGFQEQYDLLEEIGKGAMAKVYLIERKQDRKKFAAKIISLKTESEKTYDTFINETNILRILSSPHVVSLQGVYVSQKKQLIQVLEYLNGGTLFSLLKQKKLKTRKDKFQAAKDITLGLEHLRQKRIIHRDLKLENIMIRNQENGSRQYVITDFGLSNWIGERNILFQKCGTPGYLAPQILRQKKGICLLTHSTDIFSLGVLFHYIYMNQGVFTHNQCIKTLIQNNKKGIFSLRQAQRHLHDNQFALLTKTLQIDPLRRSSSKELLQNQMKQLQEYIKRREQLKAIKSKRQNKHIESQKIQREGIPTSQIQQQRLPSYKFKSLNVTSIDKGRAKTQVSQQKRLESSRLSMQSAKKAFVDVAKKISSSFSLTKRQHLKTKDKAEQRVDMKSFLD